jgi:hypothetical protein
MASSSYEISEVDCPDCTGTGRCARCRGHRRLRRPLLAGEPVELPVQSARTFERDIIEVTALAWHDVEDRLLRAEVAAGRLVAQIRESSLRRERELEDVWHARALLWLCVLLSVATLGGWAVVVGA